MYSSRILFRYILREQTKVFLLAAAAITLVMNFSALLLYLQEYRWLPLGSLLRILPYHTPILLPWILPLAVLMAVTLTYGRLSSDNEILAIQLAGMHLVRPVMPAVALGLTVAGALVLVGDQALPWCRAREYQTYLEESERILVRVFETQSEMKGAGYAITWDGFENQTLRNVSVKERVGGDVVAVFTAREATYSTDGASLTLSLKDIRGTNFAEGYEIRWDSHVQSFPMKAFMRDPDYKAMSTREMLGELDKLKVAPSPINEWDAQMRERRRRDIQLRLHRLYSLSLSALALALVGVPLGLLARQAHMLSAFFLGCLPVMLVYYPVFLLGESMASEGSIPAAAGCWTPTAVVAAVGLGLLGWLFSR